MLTTRSHSSIPVTDNSSLEQSSPSISNSNNTSTQSISNVQAFSVFANVNIPERNGPKWNTSIGNINYPAANNLVSTLIQPLSVRTEPQQSNDFGDTPVLPKKINSTGSSQIVYSSTFGDASSTTRLDTVSTLSDECVVEPAAQLSWNNQTGNDSEPLPSPLPRVIVSPLKDIHSTSNRSPFHCTTSINKPNCTSSSHFR